MAGRSGPSATCSRTRNDDPRPKYYVLEMFPYPSGRIHMGHVRNYAMGDVVARYKRAARLQRAASDGLGRLRHAGRERRDAEQGPSARPGPTPTSPPCGRSCKSMGLSLDWSREIATCDPAYYKHQQRMFLDFLDGRASSTRRTAKVNWDPVDQTVLANEQVIDGRGWRSGALVEQRELTQWFFKITDYAQDLHDALDTLDRWPEKVRLMQRNWIGRSEGLLVRFALDPATHAGRRDANSRSTRRGPTRCSARSSWRSRPTIRWRRPPPPKNPALAAFIEECRSASARPQAAIETAEKKGFDTGIRAAIRSTRPGRCRSTSRISS